MGGHRSILIFTLLGTVLVALVFAIHSLGYRATDGLGSGGVPRMVAAILLLMSLLALKEPITGWWRDRHSATKVKTKESFRPALSVLFFLLYVIALAVKFPGFVISTLCLLVAQCLLLRKKSGGIAIVIVYAIVITGITYVLFVRLLYLRI